MSERQRPVGEQESDEDNSSEKTLPLQEGIDYYIENGLMVFTGTFLGKRGFCCESGCRHCPYGFKPNHLKRTP